MAQNIPKEFIDNLLEKANIVDIIGSYIKLEKKGNDYWAKCPFHNEKTSSFSVSESKQFFHCFGCSAHGNAIGFVMEHANKTYPEAIETIANSLGIEIPRNKESAKQYEIKKIIQESLEDAKDLYVENLKNSKLAIDYLKSRNISGATAKLFGIGYAENDFQNLNKNLGRKFTESNLLDAGLIVKKDKNAYDKFRGRIMFPIFDTSGKVIAFGGRNIIEADKIDLAKYMNSPETVLFSKKKVLYNLNLARKDKSSKESIFIVEGYMDVVALHQAEIKNVVATLGTAVTKDNLEQCFKYTKEIICCFDGDKAGEKAAWKGVENIMSVIKDGDEINFVFLPENNDPDDIVNEGGKELWKELVQRKISIEDFIYKKFSRDSNLDTAAGKTQYLQKVDELLKPLKAPIMRKMLHESLNEKIGAKYLSQADNVSIKKKTKKNFTTSSPLQKAILILLHHPNLKIDQDLLQDNRISDNKGVILIKSILNKIENDESTNMGRIIESFREDEKTYRTLEKISMMEIMKLEWPEKEFNACLCLTIKNVLQEKLDNIDSMNLEEFSNLKKEMSEIQDKAKNF